MRCFGAALLLCGIASASAIEAQTVVKSGFDWQKDAGDSMAFEVASVREDKGEFKIPSFPLSSDEAFQDPKGRFHADFALPTYIQFAYKVSLTGEE